MHEVQTVPTARPVTPTATDPCVPGGELVPYPPAAGQPPYVPSAADSMGVPARGPTDGLAIASAVCGLTAIVPIVSQLLGLGFGIASLRRLGRARRQGYAVGGGGWAWAGILTSGFALIGWVGLFLLLAMVGSSIAGTQDSLQTILQNMPAHG